MESDQKRQEQLDAIELKVTAIEQTVRELRKYLLIILWGTTAMFALPLIGLLIVVPIALRVLQDTLTAF
ncbi:MAG: hypothetical protein ACOC4E_02145 [Patescibacteria group bacterium]